MTPRAARTTTRSDARVPPKLTLVPRSGTGRPAVAAVTPPISDRVRTARACISAGYYDRPDVRERVLSALLDDLED